MITIKFKFKYYQKCDNIFNYFLRVAPISHHILSIIVYYAVTFRKKTSFAILHRANKFHLHCIWLLPFCSPQDTKGTILWVICFSLL